ncbi:hypothetical protein [Paraburkholderia sejongensis]|uniref:hypothetical protein n=1 Tax=Paraburkholderia sejongensis TaxID=2886946 RepID=UPI003CE55ECB
MAVLELVLVSVRVMATMIAMVPIVVMRIMAQLVSKQCPGSTAHARAHYPTSAPANGIAHEGTGHTPEPPADGIIETARKCEGHRRKHRQCDRANYQSSSPHDPTPFSC